MRGIIYGLGFAVIFWLLGWGIAWCVIQVFAAPAFVTEYLETERAEAFVAEYLETDSPIEQSWRVYKGPADEYMELREDGTWYYDNEPIYDAEKILQFVTQGLLEHMRYLGKDGGGHG